jgi:uncharacterized membrane protein YhaH (DUF805 family)
MGVAASIRHNRKNLTRFGGRDDRATFWPYAGLVFGLGMAGMAAAMLPEMAESMRRMQEFAAEHPELATVQSGPGSYSISIEGHHPELMPDMAAMMGSIGIGFAFLVLMLAGAVARRLRDGGKSPLWGIAPLPFITFASVMMPKVFREEPEVGLFFAVFFNNVLYLTSLGVLIVFLAKPSVHRGEL